MDDVFLGGLERLELLLLDINSVFEVENFLLALLVILMLFGLLLGLELALQLNHCLLVLTTLSFGLFQLSCVLLLESRIDPGELLDVDELVLHSFGNNLFMVIKRLLNFLDVSLAELFVADEARSRSTLLVQKTIIILCLNLC